MKICTRGKQCGNSCIARSSTCRSSCVSQYSPMCTLGISKPCGNTCITQDKNCYKGRGSAVYNRQENNNQFYPNCRPQSRDDAETEIHSTQASDSVMSTPFDIDAIIDELRDYNPEIDLDEFLRRL